VNYVQMCFMYLVCTSNKEAEQFLYMPGQALYVQEVETARFQDSRYMKVVGLSALPTSHLYPPGNIPGTHCF
jgi:hypothetical protein